MKPDLRNVKALTPAGIRELRFKREQHREPEATKPKKKKNSPGTKLLGRKVVITSVSIRPELKIRAERDIGQGNFSKAVTRALTYVLMRLDQGENYEEADLDNPLLALPQRLR